MGRLIRILQKHRIAFELADRTLAPEWPAVFTGELTGAQVTALEACVRRRFGILSGPMRTGKRRTALAWICERRTPTLVIVKTKLQLHQWREDALALTNAEPAAVGVVGDRAYATNLKDYHELVGRIPSRFMLRIAHTPGRTGLTDYVQTWIGPPLYTLSELWASAGTGRRVRRWCGRRGGLTTTGMTTPR